jgi:hypothetical protein
MNLKQEYEQDFNQWVEHHITLLKAGRFHEMDVENLIEELADRSKGNLYELDSRFTVLLVHLLKWEHQFNQLKSEWTGFTGGSWKGVIIEQRLKIARLLKENPSLERFLPNIIAEAYQDALKILSEEMSLSMIPRECSYSMEQLLDKKYYPK